MKQLRSQQTLSNYPNVALARGKNFKIQKQKKDWLKEHLNHIYPLKTN
jgi:hypothetical protein